MQPRQSQWTWGQPHFKAWPTLCCARRWCWTCCWSNCSAPPASVPAAHPQQPWSWCPHGTPFFTPTVRSPQQPIAVAVVCAAHPWQTACKDVGMVVPAHQKQHYVPYYLSIVFFLSLKYAFGIISMFFTLVVILNLFASMFLTSCLNLSNFRTSSHVPQEMSNMASLVYYKIWDFCILFLYCTVFSSSS